MSSNWKSTGSALALAAALLTMNAAQAQTTPAAAKPAAPANQQAATPEAVFARWDKDKNNVLSFAEFKTGWQEVQAAMVLRQLRETFVAMDTNKSGAIEQSEYATLGLVKRAGASAPPMSTFDLDKNQKLDFNEYISMVKALAKPKG
jgi:Ca2+-binding EF-hand superfamily protein